jgi:hypothetical protein
MINIQDYNSERSLAMTLHVEDSASNHWIVSSSFEGFHFRPKRHFLFSELLIADGLWRCSIYPGLHGPIVF